jgi:hypothetical protein
VEAFLPVYICYPTSRDGKTRSSQNVGQKGPGPGALFQKERAALEPEVRVQVSSSRMTKRQQEPGQSKNSGKIAAKIRTLTGPFRATSSPSCRQYVYEPIYSMWIAVTLESRYNKFSYHFLMLMMYFLKPLGWLRMQLNSRNNNETNVCSVISLLLHLGAITLEYMSLWEVLLWIGEIFNMLKDIYILSLSEENSAKTIGKIPSFFSNNIDAYIDQTVK